MGWQDKMEEPSVNFAPMLKHHDLTRRRIELFLKQDVAPYLHGERQELTIELNEEPARNQEEAKAGSWRTIQPGFRYGPAYTTFWFRLTGEIPESMAGQELAVVAELGGERTVWVENSPWCGIDWQHTDMGWLDGSMFPYPDSTDRKIEIYVQSYTRNPQHRVHIRELPREPLVETVERAEIVTINRPLKAFYYDVDFCLNLLQTLDVEGPSYATLLRALNEIVNVFNRNKEESIARCRKLIKETLGVLNGELKHTIFPVGHAHLDTAWLWPIEITKKKMAHTTATQLKLMEEYPEYVFAHSQASQYEWLEKEYPELYKRVKAAIERGQWEPVGSMWVEADCNLTGAESLVRQFLYGRQYFREKLNFETHDMWLPDVFGYSAALPQILAKFNIKYFLTQKMSWNQFNKFPHHTFWWQGIDGTKIWTHFPPADTYNASCEPKEVIYSVNNYKDHARSDQSLYLFGFGDGGGGPTERHLEFLRRGRLAPHYPEVAERKKAADFFQESKARSRDLQTWVGELYGEFHRGTYTSQAANKRGNRYSEFLMRDAEYLSCFTESYPSAYPRQELEATWKLVLLNQFHDIIPGSSVNEVYRDSDRDYQAVRESGEKIVDSALRSIAGKVDTSQMRHPVALFKNATVTSQGELPWDQDWTPQALICGDETVPVQLVEAFDERRLVFSTPSAALESVAVGDLSESAHPAKSVLKTSNRRLENHEWSVKFDGHGNITSVVSIEDSSEFIKQGELANLFQLFEDKPLFWSAWDIDVFSYETGKDLVKSESFEIVERGPVRVAAEVVKRFGNSRIRQRISLGPTPGIRFDTEIDWHEEDKMLKVAFPVNVNSPRATYEIQFGNVERPTHYNTTWDLARFEVCAQKWVDLSEGDQGAALLNDCKYGHDIHGNVIRQTLLKAPKAPDPECDMGLHRFTYVFLPHYGPYNYAGIVQAAYALNAPLRAASLDATRGQVGQLPQFIRCDDRNIVIETVKKAERSNNLIVRLYECHNSRGNAELSCIRMPSAATLCDLEENPVGELPVEDGIVRFSYKPFEIITIELHL